MNRIRVSLANSRGQVEQVQLHEVSADGMPLSTLLKPGQRVYIQIDGRQQAGLEPILGKRPVLKKVGNHLVVEADGVTVIELQDFYITEEVSLSGDAWQLPDDAGLVQVALAVSVLHVSDVAAVGLSGTGSGKDLAAVGVSGTNQELAAVGVSGTNQELAAVGVSGTNQELAAVGVSGTGTGKDLAAVGVSGTGTGTDLAAVGVSGTGQDLAAVGVSGTGTGTDLAAVGVSGTGRDLAAVGLSGTGRDLASIGITGTGVNAWMAGLAMLPFLENLGGAGNDTEPSATVLRGSVVAGPVTQGLEVEIFKLENGELVTLGKVVVQAGGSWTFVVQGYKGPLVAKVIDANDGQGHDNTNYISELTGQEVDIQANLMTAFNATTGVKTVQINALTTVAAMKAGLKVNAQGNLETTESSFGAQAIENSNFAVAQACGLTDLVSGDVKAVINLDKTNSSQANEYGKFIAAIEGAGGNDQAQLNKIADGVTLDGQNAILSTWYKRQLINGAANVEGNLKLSGVASAVSDMLTRVNSSPDLLVNAIGGNDIVDDSERNGLTVVINAPTNAASIQLWVDGVLVDASVVQRQNGTWTLALPSSAWSYGAHELTVKALAEGGAVLATSYRLYTSIDTTAPVISNLVVSGLDAGSNTKTTALVAGDSIKLTLTTSETVQGWTTNDKVSLMVGDTQREAHYVGSSGNVHSFTYTVVAGDLGATGGVSPLRLMAGQVKDMAGNPLNAALPFQSNAVQVDAVSPNSPSLALATDSGDNSDGISRIGTMLVSGLESGATWAYSLDGGNTWLPGVGSSFTLGPGTYAAGALRVRQTDAAGNPSAPGQSSGQITIDAQANAPTLSLVTDSGQDNSDGISHTGTMQVSGLEDGATWEYSTNGGASWQVGTSNTLTLLPGEYAAGAIRVRQTDVAGNLSAVGENSGAIKIDTSVTVTLAQGVAGPSVNGPESTDAAGVVNVRAEPGANWTVTLTGSSGVVTKSGVGTGGSQAVVLQANDVTTLGQGAVTVTASVTDAAGNSATAAGGDFTLDTWVTRASVTAIVDDAGLVKGMVRHGKKTDDTQLTVLGTVEQALVSGDVLKVYDGDTPLEGVLTWTTATTWTFADARSLVNGQTVNYTARVHDAAGNEGSDGVAFAATISLPLGATVSVTATNVTSRVDGVSSDDGIAADAFTGLSTVSGAAGNDSIVVANGLQLNGLTVLAEAGNDTINVQGSISGFGLLGGGEGNDSISFSGAHSGQSSLEGGDGNDTFNWTGANSGLITVLGGNGTDLLNVASSTAALSWEVNGVNLGGGFNGRWVGGGNNTGSFSFEGMERFSLGGGNDTITITVNVSNLSVDGGAGNDWLDASGMSTGSVSVVAGSGQDTVLLGAGNDTVNASIETVLGNDSFSGGAGTDLLRYDAHSIGLTFSITGPSVGSGVNGTVTGTTGVGTDTFTGFERLWGSKGNDTFAVLNPTAAVSVDGGQGNDLLSYASHTAALTVNITTNTGGNVVKSTLGAPVTDSFFGIESIVAGSGDDRITVGASVSTGVHIEDGLGSDTITLGVGNDTVYATLETSFGNDSYVGGAGADLLSYVAQTSALSITITASNTGGGVDGSVVAATGIDVFNGFENIRLGNGNDSVLISALAANLQVADEGGNDTIDATAMASGGILVTVGGGVDDIRLGAGNDTINTQSGADHDLFIGGAGSDRLSYASQTGVMTANITGINAQGGADGQVVNLGGTATDSFFGFENITGGQGNDTFNVSANVSQVTLEAGAGNDLINASGMTSGGLSIVDGQGADTIVLGGGNDSVSISDAHNNSITLGAGNDSIRLTATDLTSSTAGLGVQTVADFDWSKDVLTLHQFWEAGTVTQSNLSEYMNMNGNSLQVDLDGLSSVFSMTSMVEFSAMQHFSSLAALFATDRLVITPDSVIPA